jgi:transcription antitermination factor NusG
MWVPLAHLPQISHQSMAPRLSAPASRFQPVRPPCFRARSNHRAARRPPTAQWFIVRTTPRNEQRAADELRRLGLRVYIPKRTYRPRSRRVTNPKPRRIPLLVGYVLVRFPSQLIDRHRQPQFGIVLGCRFLGGGQWPYVGVADENGDQRPMPITSDDIGDLMQRQRRNEFNELALADEERQRRVAELRASMKQGQQVLVIAGLYAGHLATVSPSTTMAAPM